MSDSAGATLPVFDKHAVLDLVDGELELIRELAEMFLEDLPGHMNSIEEALSRGDAQVVQQVTHQLKSSIGNLGGRAAQETIRVLEVSSKVGDLSSGDEQFELCREELDEFTQALNEFLG